MFLECTKIMLPTAIVISLFFVLGLIAWDTLHKTNTPSSNENANTIPDHNEPPHGEAVLPRNGDCQQRAITQPQGQTEGKTVP